ncbi:DMT family transporter [Photobacterium sp. 1_MG-2023]|uniref:DMT family transporter n=1 Tax=Photobacterium sp. 1_MG-2023 TaxID=3062646 RepID=UPI0026E488F1|nr:DMT family transporter [Photobacterium sp. 1_MG-2023]MDO6706924.1 DMT family transporter [Photobacterium sp. 1_MG-2023]
MPQMSVGFAMMLLVVGNLIAVCSDAMIKSLGEDTAIFQFVFFRQLTSVLILAPFCFTTKRADFFAGFKWHALRGHIWLLGMVFMVISITSLPLATANAIFYAAPLIMLPLAMILFQEKLSKYSVGAAVIGFMGVLVIIRPTEINWAAIAALVVAFTLAWNNLLVRKLPRHQTVAQTLMLTNLAGMPAALALAVWEGQPWDFTPFWTAAGSSAFILIYAGACVLAYRAAESNKIASAEYSGLIGAVVLGMVWFDEIPDLPMILGTVMIILPLVWLAQKEKRAKKKAAAYQQNPTVSAEAVEES